MVTGEKPASVLLQQAFGQSKYRLRIRTIVQTEECCLDLPCNRYIHLSQ